MAETEDISKMVSCTGKTPFESRKAANKALKRLKRGEGLSRSEHNGRKIEPYFCKHCLSFHLGHSSYSKREMPTSTRIL